MIRISSTSKETVRVRVNAKVAGAVPNLSLLTVEMAIIPGTRKPVTGDWKAATWDTDATSTPTAYRAQIVVGPGSTVGALAPGVYYAWARVTDTGERPELNGGAFEVY